MLRIENFSKFYGDNRAVDNISLEIRDGEIFGLIGHNGAGKSTAIKAITGVITPDEGKIYVEDFDVTENEIEAKKSIGYVSDTPDHFLKLTAGEFYDFMADIYEIPNEKRLKSLSRLIRLMEMEGTEDVLIGEMSHGMRQKVFVIGALLTDPPVWILDEPMHGLDPSASYNLKQLMKEHASKGNTVLFSTHALDTAEKVCDRIGILKKGKLLYVGTLADLENTGRGNSLEEIYLNMIREEGTE